MAKNKKKKVNEQVEINAPVNDALNDATLSNDNQTQKTNSKKNSKNSKNNKDKKPNIFVRIGRSFKEMFSEMKKVSWADGKTVLSSAMVVLGVVLIFFLVILGIDAGLTKLLELMVG